MPTLVMRFSPFAVENLDVHFFGSVARYSEKLCRALRNDPKVYPFAGASLVTHFEKAAI
jgi:hypothetical protein